MTSQDLTDLAHANLRKYNTQKDIDQTFHQHSPAYHASDMLAFYKQGIREGLALVLKDIFDPEDKERLEEDMVGYHLQDVYMKYLHLLPEDPQPTSL